MLGQYGFMDRIIDVFMETFRSLLNTFDNTGPYLFGICADRAVQ